MVSPGTSEGDILGKHNLFAVMDELPQLRPFFANPPAYTILMPDLVHETGVSIFHNRAPIKSRPLVVGIAEPQAWRSLEYSSWGIHYKIQVGASRKVVSGARGAVVSVAPALFRLIVLMHHRWRRGRSGWSNQKSGFTASSEGLHGGDGQG